MTNNYCTREHRLQLFSDPTVERLVQAWLGITPHELDLPFEDFLLMTRSQVERYGEDFRRNHSNLVKNILVQYANSIRVIDQMTAGQAPSLVDSGEEERFDACDFDELGPGAYRLCPVSKSAPRSPEVYRTRALPLGE